MAGYYAPQRQPLRESNADRSLGQLGNLMSIIAPFLGPYLPDNKLDEEKRQFDAMDPVRQATVGELGSRTALNNAQATDPSRQIAAQAALDRNVIDREGAQSRAQSDRLTALPGMMETLKSIGIPQAQLAEYAGSVDPQFGQVNQQANQATAGLRAKIMGGQPLTPEEQAMASNDPRLGLLMATMSVVNKKQK